MPYIPKAVCVACELPLAIVKNGYRVEALAKSTNGNHRQYYRVEGDLYRCPGCGMEIVTGFAREPYAESFQPNYNDTPKPNLTVLL